MAAETLSFSAANGGFESDWFQPNNPFQLDLLFPTQAFITKYGAVRTRRAQVI